MTTKNTKNATESGGIYVYIGPTIRGVVQNGSIFSGSRESVEEKLASAIEKYPKIKRLIIKDTDLAEAREKIQTSGNGLSVAYNALISAQ